MELVNLKFYINVLLIMNNLLVADQLGKVIFREML